MARKKNKKHNFKVGDIVTIDTTDNYEVVELRGGRVLIASLSARKSGYDTKMSVLENEIKLVEPLVELEPEIETQSDLEIDV